MKDIRLKKADKIMKIVYLVAGLLLMTGIEARAQFSVQTEGVPESLESRISSQIESFLASFQEGSLSDFTPEILSDEFKNSVSGLELVADQDEVYTTAVQSGEKLEVYGILMRSEKDQNTILEVVLDFSKAAELQQVRFGDTISNTSWIVTRDLTVTDDKTISMLKEVLDQYKNTIQEKNDSALTALFAENGFVVSSTKSETFDGFEIVKHTIDEYISRLTERIFRDENTIQVYLQDSKFYHHPVFEDVYGISVIQTWNSTYYADQGNLFMVVDNRSSDPKIYSREWQSRPFVKLEYLEEELDPYIMSVFHTDIESGNFMNSYDGEILFSVNSQIPGYKNSGFIKKILEEGLFTMEEVNLNLQHAKVQNEQLVVPFTADFGNENQVIESTVTYRGDSAIEPYSTNINVFAERRNFIGLQIGENSIKKETPDYFGTVDVTVNTDSVLININSEHGREIVSKIVSDKSDSYNLLEGSYYLDATKSGYESGFYTLQVKRGENRTETINLDRIPVFVEEEPRKPKGFIARNKYWIMSGVAAIATSAVIMFSNGGGDDAPGIPIPPGRPGMN